MSQKDFTCKACNINFPDKTRKDEHHRVNHQKSVKVKTLHGETVEVPRGHDEAFHCPTEGCTHHVANPRNLAGHVKRCMGPSSEQSRRPIVNYDGQQVRLIPHGQDIKVDATLEKYGMVWNQRCRILICATCHVGLPFKEVHSHHMNDDHTRNVDKDVMMSDLQEYESQIAAGPFPPGHVQGQHDKPIEGLLLYNGFTCKLCQKSWKAMKSVINHFITNHKGKICAYLSVEYIC
ncbi:hypothetical protein DFH28DRAFT_916952 [Melampsora americana]|nr:hypothetical protein DFH28DRAFT_918689 [Melampsora americana]KAH9807125.1 hypothetical protein DFH28DRAFT_916952 [Melampsora americana]